MTTSYSEPLSRLRAAGVNVIADGDRLILRPARNVPGDLVPTIRRRKPELLDATRRAVLDRLALHDLDSPDQIQLLDDLESDGWPRVELMRLMAEHVVERTVQAARMPGELPRELRRWPATPRYVVAVLERRGRPREAAVDVVRRAWRDGADATALRRAGVADASKVWRDATGRTS